MWLGSESKALSSKILVFQTVPYMMGHHAIMLIDCHVGLAHGNSGKTWEVGQSRGSAVSFTYIAYSGCEL